MLAKLLQLVFMRNWVGEVDDMRYELYEEGFECGLLGVGIKEEASMCKLFGEMIQVVDCGTCWESGLVVAG